MLRRGIVSVALVAIAFWQGECRARNPFTAGETTSNDTVTWRKRGEHLWKLDNFSMRGVLGEPGKSAGVVCGDNLITFSADGTPETNVVPLSKNYVFIGLRPTYIVGIARAPAEVQILDRRSGRLLRTASLGEGEPTSLQLHPFEPVAYVSLSRRKMIAQNHSVQGFFVMIDESSADLRQSNDQPGQTLVIDPQGRFLIAGFADSIPLGSQIVQVPGGTAPDWTGPGPSVRRSPYVPQPGLPTGPIGPYGARPNPGYVPVPDQTALVTQFAKISIGIVYDLDDERSPEPIGIFEFSNFVRGLRLSFDGRLLSAFNYERSFEARDPTDAKKDPIRYDAERLGITVAANEFAHHPTIPVTVVVGPDKLEFFDTMNGRRLSENGPESLPFTGTFVGGTLTFSPDGRYVSSAVKASVAENRLVRIPVPLSPENRKLLEERNANRPAGGASGKLSPLAAFDAFRGGLLVPMRSSEISKRFANSVVVVRSRGGSGTGFVVGSSGYILTCAHCVSRLLPTVVAYKAVGGAGEETEIEVDAEIVLRDAKLDLALLKIKSSKPLPSVVLASPLDAAHGEEVTVIANPVLGDTILKNTITTGVVSNPKLEIDGDGYIQSSAAVNPGSSGGPMFDQHGRVIGMVVLKGRIEGVGFAIPSRRITEFLLRSATFAGEDGKLLRSWSDDAEKSERKGAIVKSDDAKLTILETGNQVPQSLDIAKLSPGDRAFLKLMTTAISKRTP